MLDNILKLENKFDVFMFDIYGVLWNGKTLINRAEEVLKHLKSKGKEVILLSNATFRGCVFEEKYAKQGLIKGIHYDSLVTSGDLAFDFFSNDDRELKYYNFGRPQPMLFEKSKYKEVNKPETADFVYVGSPQIKEGEEWENVLTIDFFEEELNRLKKLNKTLICVNPDLRAHESSHDEPVIRHGSIALRYQEMGGDVEFFGKPYPEIFDFALKDCTTDDNRILMVGDTLETDILGANSYGIKSALITTGISYENMIKEDLSDIKEYAKSLDIIPDYFL